MKYLLLVWLMIAGLSACNDDGALVLDKKNVLLGVKNYADDGTYQITQYLYTPDGKITGTETYSAAYKLISYDEYTYNGNSIATITTHLADKSKAEERKYTVSDKELVTKQEILLPDGATTMKKIAEQTFEYNTSAQLLKITINTTGYAPTYQTYTYEGNNVKSITQATQAGNVELGKWVYTYDNNKNPYYKLNSVDLTNTDFQAVNNVLQCNLLNADGKVISVFKYDYVYDTTSHLPLKKYMTTNDGPKKLVTEFEYR